MTAPEIAAALSPGNARRVGQWWRCVCPVHGSRTGRSLSLALRDNPRGLAVRCHAGCSRDDVLTELRRMGLLTGEGSCAAAVRPIERRDDDKAARRIEIPRRIWGKARDARGSPVAGYLTGRGITMAVPPSLRWVPSLRRPDGTHASAMVARVESLDGELVGVHRTWLDRDAAGQWRRRDRASLGPVGGGAVRLAPAAETLMIAEGIETALAAMQATAQPAWAALSTSGMVALALPPIVRTVVILADHDHNGAGERAARAAAQRGLAGGRRVRKALPPAVGTDFADVLAGRAYARVVEIGDVAA